MVNWQVTAKTIYCEAVQEEVTIIIRKDWSVQCTGCRESSGSTGAVNGCEGLGCSRIARYKEQLMKEEGQADRK